MTCRRHAVPDVPTLAGRLGDDYGCMHWDLIKVLYCQPCREACRDNRNLVFTNHAMTPDKRR